MKVDDGCLLFVVAVIAVATGDVDAEDDLGAGVVVAGAGRAEYG